VNLPQEISRDLAGVSSRKIVHDYYLISPTEQMLRGDRADVSGSPGDQDLRHEKGGEYAVSIIAELYIWSIIVGLRKLERFNSGCASYVCELK
jgi:hypothetical protein